MVVIAGFRNLPFQPELTDVRGRLILAVLNEIGPQHAGTAVAPKNVGIAVAVEIASAGDVPLQAKLPGNGG